jgi:hypothetical protein
MWDYGLLKKTYIIHKGHQVTCLNSKFGLFSAGSDGKVIKWEINKPYINMIEIVIEVSRQTSLPPSFFNFYKIYDKFKLNF